MVVPEQSEQAGGWLTRAKPVMRGHVIKSVQASGRTDQGDMRPATAPGGSGDGQGPGDAVEGGNMQDAS